MKEVTFDSLGFTIKATNIPTTLQEAIQLSGSEDEVLGNHIAYVDFHVHRSAVRKAIVEFLEKATGIPRNSEEKDGKTKITETENSYVNRLRLELGDEEVDKHAPAIAELITEIDWTPGRRGGGKLSNKWLAYYDQLVESENLDAFCEKHDIDADQPEEVLKPLVALKVKSLVEAQLKAATESALAV